MMSRPLRAVTGAGAGAKICRLCADTSGPFLNIFDMGMEMSTKIRKLLTIEISEWDDLPHKICYRCSAKVTELHEFADKCRQTQTSLFDTYGVKPTNKDDKVNKTRNSWETKLLEKNMSNDEYCDELIKKALDSLPTLKNEPNSLVGPKVPSQLKELRIVLTKIDNKHFDRKTPPSALKSKTISNVSDGKWLDKYTLLNVTGVGAIYTCKKCGNVLLTKQKAFNHICSKENNFRPTKNCKSQISNNTSNSTTNITTGETSIGILNDENISKSLGILNQSSQSVTTLNSNQTNKFLVKMPDNTYVLLRVMDTNGTPNDISNAIASVNGNTNSKIQQSNIVQSNGNINTFRTQTLINSKKKSKSLANLQRKNKNAILSQNLKSSEPYPVGLFCRTAQDSNPLAGPSKLDESKTNVPKKNRDKKQKKIIKHYKVTTRDSTSKIVISNIKNPLNAVSAMEKEKKGKSASIKHDISNLVHIPTDGTPMGEQYFTFVNIDPISKPSYVLPTDSIVQESQISTTVAPLSLKKLRKKSKKKRSANDTESDGEHACYICFKKFDKHSIDQFVAHIQSHADCNGGDIPRKRRRL
ncbi:uncharacterized protein LOC143911073 [Arctopsyche grandis]|uniref:uncharacterized protein LOC143911073 n=1 Tax=Arctopsyche grandis TaxID=121162 RepID=UPI00406D6C28